MPADDKPAPTLRIPRSVGGYDPDPQKIIDAAVALVTNWDEWLPDKNGGYGGNRLDIYKMTKEEIDLLIAVRPEIAPGEDDE